MLNQTILVGRLVDNLKVEKNEEGKKRSRITLAVPRSYKNADGVYETDFIDCVAFDSIAENTCEYCKKGDIIGVKGRIQTTIYEDKEGEKKKSTEIIAEKITFLSSSKSKEENEEKSNDDLDME